MNTAAPGLSVLVHRPGEQPQRWTTGLAHLETSTPITPDTAFITGSTAKQITAHLVIEAAVAGALRLDQPVAELVPAIRVPGVTVTDLITHQSGIRDTESLLPFAGLRDLDHYTADDLLALAAREKHRAVPPGQFLYSNTNYLLLTRILQTVHGTTLDDLARASVFGPLGMDATRFKNDPRDVIPNAASAYRPTSTGWQHTAQPAPLPGAGSLSTTPDDLNRWLDHLHRLWNRDGGHLPHQHAIPYRPSDHAPYLYGAGLYADPRPGRRTVFHSGHEHGFSAAAHLTSSGARVVCLSNHAGVDAARAAAVVVAALGTAVLDLTALLTEHVAATSDFVGPGVPLSQADDRAHVEVGTYACPEVPGVLRLTRTSSGFHLWRLGTCDQLVQTGPRTHAGPGYRITLDRDQHAASFQLDLQRAPGLQYQQRDRVM
ncbi:serine hydrolase domain-containing protein [Kitasatospora sp. NPDC098652]|uniref:serine hydrolase domain-containing protein n=1 Tax=Kitasatospora sp. NPDC098652 TaxID=3364095 RepID=UPI00382F0E43